MSENNPLPGEAGHESIYFGSIKNSRYQKQNVCCGLCLYGGGGGCRWVDDFKPIPGWIAEKVPFDCSSQLLDDSTYIIKWCPNFVQGDKIHENVEAMHKAHREPYEVDDEGIMKLAERIIYEAAEEFKQHCENEKMMRDFYRSDFNKWEKYYEAYLQRKQYDDVFPEGIRQRLMLEVGFKEDLGSERKIKALAKKKSEDEEELREIRKKEAEENAERLKNERLTRLEADRELKKEQKRVDKNLSKEDEDVKGVHKQLRRIRRRSHMSL